MYARNNWVKWGTAVICVLMIGTQFQQFFKISNTTTDNLGRCTSISVMGGTTPENIHIGGDFAVRLILSGLFVYANIYHSSKIKDIDAKSRFFRLIKNDFRASFIDIVALLIKFSTTLANLPTNQTRFLFHFMDFAKVAGTHWFVYDITMSTMNSTGSNQKNSNTTAMKTEHVISKPLSTSRKDLT
ncbi:hypothetical protein HK096_002863 [Nowakowskiella sp. JEL0078]|nr:hypothetical protein HK096_002863 [Nowakowskiella sp. JEL0078]